MKIIKSIKVWFLKNIAKKRVVLVVSTSGEDQVKALNFTPQGVAYIIKGKSSIGFLDNHNQLKGEFKKRNSCDTLLKWIEL